jgi:hypothetical protein
MAQQCAEIYILSAKAWEMMKTQYGGHKERQRFTHSLESKKGRESAQRAQRQTKIYALPGEQGRLGVSAESTRADKDVRTIWRARKVESQR